MSRKNFPKVKNNPDPDAFEAWLRAQGAEVIPRTSDWEFARFRAHESLHIIYMRADGTFSAQEFGLECLAVFRRGGTLGMGLAKPRKGLGHRKAILMKRDGNACFFCGLPMTEDEATIEHLVPLSRGGPNTDENLALAHEACNQSAGAASLMDKIRTHCEVRMRQAFAEYAFQNTPIRSATL